MIFVYITCKDKQQAKKISKSLLEKNLVACTNFYPIESMYWWKEKIQNDNEYVLILKTTKKNFNKIKKEVEKLDSYEVHCILSWDIDRGNKGYIDWVKKQCE